MESLSTSRVWDLQRAYYERAGSGAFAEVPHQIVDNPYVARAFARVVIGFLRDGGMADAASSGDVHPVANDRKANDELDTARPAWAES